MVLAMGYFFFGPARLEMWMHIALAEHLDDVVAEVVLEIVLVVVRQMHRSLRIELASAVNLFLFSAHTNAIGVLIFLADCFLWLLRFGLLGCYVTHWLITTELLSGGLLEGKAAAAFAKIIGSAALSGRLPLPAEVMERQRFLKPRRLPHY